MYYYKMLVSEARSILLGNVLTYSYKKGNNGRYFRVEEVKKKGNKFIVSGLGDGRKEEITLTAANIIQLDEHRVSEYEFNYEDGEQYYRKYVLC